MWIALTGGRMASRLGISHPPGARESSHRDEESLLVDPPGIVQEEAGDFVREPVVRALATLLH
ncbi:hypothetical protein ACIBQ1_61275 [Nonomuraea sp. NPDC050153]|uniref:hypothetical protein n=1 Tax=Nonomuraea sp. NPDC050153 TaxID=3364359 RepID=UPI00378E5AD8